MKMDATFLGEIPPLKRLPLYLEEVPTDISFLFYTIFLLLDQISYCAMSCL